MTNYRQYKLMRKYGFYCQSQRLLKMYKETLNLPIMWDWGSKHCGSVFKHIHHIDRNPKNNDIDNLMPLCEECHIFIHQGWPVELSNNGTGTYNIFTGKIKRDK